MAAKRRIVHDSENDDDGDNGDNGDDAEVTSNKKARTVLDKPGVDGGVRRSERSGKGSGGRLTQMKNFERLQTERLRWPSALDVATEGEGLNPMAPSSQDAGRSAPRKGPATSHSVETIQAPPPPEFTLAAPGQQFGFRLPGNTSSQTNKVIQAPVRTRFLGVSSRPSVNDDGSVPQTVGGTRPPTRTRFSSSQGSAPPSRGASLFSDGSLRAASTAPTSRAPSDCSSNEQRVAQQHGLRFSSENPSRRHPSASLDNREGDTSPVRLQRTSYDLPLRIDRNGEHRSAVPDLNDAGDVESEREIDEASPSEDERFAERMLLRNDDEFGRLPDYSSRTPPPPSTDDQPTVNNVTAQRRRSQLASHTFGRAQGTPPPPTTDDQPTVNNVTAQRRRSQLVPHTFGRAQGTPPPPTTDEPTVNHATAQHRRSQLGSHTFTRAQVSNGAATQQEQTYPGDPDTSQPRLSQQPENVVTVHRHRNRAPRLPSNAELLVVRQRQTLSTNRVAGASEPSRNGDDEESPATSRTGQESTSAPKTGRPVRSASERAEPWQLQFYDPPTRDIIERAKQFSHCDAASIDAFPVRATFNTKAIEYIDEAISERQSRGLIISDGWWPQHASSITRLLWEDLGSWRSAMRKKARTFVTQRYQWDAENRRDRNIEIAKSLLGNGGLFLRDGIDEEEHVNNLAHPALSGLIIDFFYTGSTSVGRLFPEVFSQEVPRVAVAIAATALKVVLDEVASGQGEVNFRVNIYMPVYTEMIGLMNKCDTSLIHCAKTRDLRRRWAQLGSNGIINEELSTGGCGFDVDLD